MTQNGWVGHMSEPLLVKDWRSFITVFSLGQLNWFYKPVFGVLPAECG